MEFDIGYLGGGQLARMSIQAAQRMGLRCLSLDPGSDTPASQIAPAIQGALDDPEKVAEIFRRCDRVTLENEFIPASVIPSSEKMTPTLESLATIQDKLLQREALARAGVPSPHAVPIERHEEIAYPKVLKARFGGYDGKGTRYAKSDRDLPELSTLQSSNPLSGWLAEEFVPFKRELAAMVYISDRQTGCFPVMETVQTNHVCDLVFPAFHRRDADATAKQVAIAAVEAVGGSGLYGVEMFELDSGDVLINELAPRPHNTGHYTLDWGGVSQFEQHVRLVMGLPAVEPRGQETCMANLLGQEGAGDFRTGLRAAIEGDPDVRVHWYGKLESRPGRKMGHLNVVGEECLQRAIEARKRFYAAWTDSTRP